MGIETLLDYAKNQKPAKLATEFDSIMKEKIQNKVSEMKDEISSNIFEAGDTEQLDELVAGKKRTAAERLAAKREAKKKTAKKIKKNKKLKRIRKTAAFKVKVKKREKLNVGKKQRTARRREQEAKKRR